MKKKLKFLRILCAAAIIFNGLAAPQFTLINSITASAEIGIYDNMLLYSIDSDAVSITGCLEGVCEELVIPSEIEGLPVVRITSTAFTNCSFIKTVSVPASVQEIETGAFAKCTNLFAINVDNDNPAYSSYNGILLDKYGACLLRCPGGIDDSQFEFPENVSFIAGTAFQGCVNIVDIIIPETVSDIGVNTFAGCISLQRIVLPSSINQIGSDMFNGCSNLSDIILPEKLEYIGERAFLGCTSLSDIILPENLTELSDQSFSGCTSLSHISLSENILRIGSNCFSGCKSLEYIVLPNSISEIGSYAFSNCSVLKELVIPNNVMLIEKGAFFNCNALENIVLSTSITELYTDTFYGCSSLKEIDITSEISKIESYTFSGCTALENITVSYDNKSYLDYNGVLMSKDMSTIIYYPAAKANACYVIPETVTNIESGAFESCCGIEHIKFSDNIIMVGDGAFYNSYSISNVYLGNGLKNISENMFSNCKNLEDIYIPENIVSIGRNAFYGCKKLKDLKISNGVKRIESEAFFDCNITSVSIPESVTDIGDYAFGYKILENDEGKNKVPISEFQIFGYSESAAEKYALSCGFPFTKLSYSSYTTTTPVYTNETSTAVSSISSENNTSTISNTNSSTTMCTTVTTVTVTTNNTTISSNIALIPSENGDVNCDGNVNLSDATLVLMYYAMNSVSIKASFRDLVPNCDEQAVFLAADMNGDNVININDSVIILKKYAQRAVK